MTPGFRLADARGTDAVPDAARVNHLHPPVPAVMMPRTPARAGVRATAVGIGRLAASRCARVGAEREPWMLLTFATPLRSSLGA
jgi:hypothetical protein